MYTIQEQEIIHLADSYTLLYAFLGGALLERCGLAGERALRIGTRAFGRDRAETLRARHLDANVKINMHSLFAVGHDLPPDPRFQRELQELNLQERVSHTLYCPMAAIWKAYGAMELGRIYCEEFHNACYTHYAYGYTKVNLAKTLTQAEDGYCAFHVVLRPANLPENLRPICFAEYDPTYAGPTRELRQAFGQAGFRTLFIKLYAHIGRVAMAQLGDAGLAAIRHGLRQLAADAANRLTEAARAQECSISEDFFARNYPLHPAPNEEPMWETYGGNGLKEMMAACFYAPVYEALGLPPLHE